MPSAFLKPERPIGIIRTLPSLYGNASSGAKKYKKSIRLLEQGKIDRIHIAMQAIPKIDILYIYLIVDGKVDVRLNLAGFQSGSEQKCWDNTIRRPKYWAICTGPVSRPPETLLRRGFQGFRYTEELW